MAKYRSNQRILGLALSLGGMVCVFVVGGAYLGFRLDDRFDSHPKLTMFFLGLGLMLSFYNFYRLIRE